MSTPETSLDLPSVTSSQESEDGPSPCDSQAGQTADLFGLVALIANPSPQPASNSASKTIDTSRPTSSRWFEPSGLLSSLENRLPLQSTKTPGLMIYSMNWKTKVTPRGRRYFQLVASARRTFDSEFSSLLNGWVPPNTTDTNGARELDGKRSGGLNTQATLTGWRTPTAQSPNSLRGSGQDPIKRKAQGHAINLTDEVTLVGWPTATTRDWKDGEECQNVPTNALLGREVWKAGGPTPRQTDGEKNVRSEQDAMQEIQRKGGPQDLAQGVSLAGWPTPQAGASATEKNNAAGNTDFSRKTEALCGKDVKGHGIPNLMAGWPAPMANDAKGSTHCNGPMKPDGTRVAFDKLPGAALKAQPVRLLADGTILTGSSAGMESGDRLSAHFSRWLMGFPIAWDIAALQIKKKGKQ